MEYPEHMGNVVIESESGRLLDPRAFEAVLDSEIQRAARSHGYLTLVLLGAQREFDGRPADDDALAEMAAVVMQQVRDTDVIGMTRRGLISVALLDAELSTCTTAIARLVQRLDGCEFATAVRFTLGAACCPTDAEDVDSLIRHALTSPVMKWRSGSPDLRVRD